MTARSELVRRAHGVELLDSGTLSLPELQTNLEDLARLNRLPGGTATSLKAVADLLNGGRPGAILDVGIGAGDIPLALARRGWRVSGVDSNPEVLAVARNRTRETPGVTLTHGDATELPFRDDAFDVVHCSLLIHHFEPAAAIAALREMRRVARVGVVINDLRRGTVPLAVTAVLVAALGRCRATRHDGMLSARRAYTVAELDELLAAAGLKTVWRSRAWMPRVVTAAIAASS